MNDNNKCIYLVGITLCSVSYLNKMYKLGTTDFQNFDDAFLIVSNIDCFKDFAIFATSQFLDQLIVILLSENINKNAYVIKS